MRQLQFAFVAMFGAALLLAAAPAAEAAKGPGTPPSSAANVKKCAKGQIWHKKKKKCVKTESGILPDEDLFWQARELALGGDYDWAIQVFGAMADQSDPEVLKYIGYSYRKSGRFDLAEGYYHQALALDPDRIVVREYLGEGYASIGRIDLARRQLAEIAARCGHSCEEYVNLAEAIAQAGQ